MPPARRRAFDDTTPKAPFAPSLPEDLDQRDLAPLRLDDEDRLERVELTGTAPPDLRARNVTIEDARIRGSLAGARLRDLHLHDAELIGADLANVDLKGAHLSRLTITDARLTGAQLIEATLQDVALVNCRIDFAVLALARLDRVLLRECDLTEATLEQAQLRDVRLESCNLTRASIGRSQHTRVELHGCRLTELRSIADLRGAALPWPDLVDQAPAFAAALGIRAATDPDADPQTPG
ncbi:MAG TPA: pentapeptide repeat-containing protein [Baekduia sp.]|nr:pentapeptide repeat-containing protein [Baekduia sp.]